MPLYPRERDSVPTTQEGEWAPDRKGTENLSSTGIRSPDRSALCESLYLLRYAGVTKIGEAKKAEFISLSNHYFRESETVIIIGKKRTDLGLVRLLPVLIS
jgi:hypothetical protein